MVELVLYVDVKEIKKILLIHRMSSLAWTGNRC